MDAEDLAQEVRCLRAELRDMQNRFAEEGARLNTEIAFWKLKFYEACALIPEPDLPREYDTGWITMPLRERIAARESVEQWLVEPGESAGRWHTFG